MYKLVVLYPEPTDRVAFEEHYRTTHIPLAETLPGLRAYRFSLAVDGVVDTSPYFAVFEGEFDDAASLDAALASPEGARVSADVPNYATGGAVMIKYPVEP